MGQPIPCTSLNGAVRAQQAEYSHRAPRSANIFAVNNSINLLFSLVL